MITEGEKQSTIQLSSARKQAAMQELLAENNEDDRYLQDLIMKDSCMVHYKMPPVSQDLFPTLEKVKESLHEHQAQSKTPAEIETKVVRPTAPRRTRGGD